MISSFRLSRHYTSKTLFRKGSFGSCTFYSVHDYGYSILILCTFFDPTLHFGLDKHSLDDENGEDITRNLRGETAYEIDRPVCVTAAENNATENRISLYRNGAAVFEESVLQGTYQETLREPSLYRFVVQSSESAKGTSGETAWEFLITGNASEPVINAVILPEDGQEPLSAIPTGSFRVQTEISSEPIDMTGASLWFAGYGQKGKLLELQSREISDSLSVTFSVKNAEGRIQNAKVFLLSSQFAPLCASADIG